jgi:CRISPR-associated endonuclease/helicase Cas3
MNTLFYKLLAWLNAVGTSVIILSATLPAKTRRAMVKAYIGKDLLSDQQDYPALTIANSKVQETHLLPEPDSYLLHLNWDLRRAKEDIVNFLQVELSNGGCAAVICNTVARAQEVYCAISETEIIPQEELILFHSRFPPVWRRKIETQALRKFGKPGSDDQSQRPHKAIVVATQVIEQSLDLDFDVMVTDMAPVDLILQRAGRLHRHKHNERYGLPLRLVITEPYKDDSGLPDFGNDQWVYAPYILLRSYLALRNREFVTIPGDTVELIESVYDPNAHLDLPTEDWSQALQQTRSRLEKEERETQAKARRYVVPGPEKRNYLEPGNYILQEDNPAVHQTFQARTRDIDLSLSLVCLHKIGDEVGVFQEDGSMLTFSLQSKLSTELSRILLQNAISIQNKRLVLHFLEHAVPSNWRENAALRFCRAAIFINGKYEGIPGHIITITRELGLQITKLEAA